MKSEADIRQQLAAWLDQEPGPVLTKEYQQGYYHALAEVLGDHEFKRRVAAWFRNATKLTARTA